MEFITNIVGWVIAHGAEIVAAGAAIHVAALAVVNLTATPKDNAVLAKVYGVFEFCAGLISKEAKVGPGPAKAE